MNKLYTKFKLNPYCANSFLNGFELANEERFRDFYDLVATKALKLDLLPLRWRVGVKGKEAMCVCIAPTEETLKREFAERMIFTRSFTRQDFVAETMWEKLLGFMCKYLKFRSALVTIIVETDKLSDADVKKTEELQKLIFESVVKYYGRYLI